MSECGCDYELVEDGAVQRKRWFHAPDCPNGESAAKVWRNSVPCMCSVTVSAKGTVLDKSACPRHGKAAKS